MLVKDHLLTTCSRKKNTVPRKNKKMAVVTKSGSGNCPNGTTLVVTNSFLLAAERASQSVMHFIFFLFQVPNLRQGKPVKPIKPGELIKPGNL